MPSKVRRLSLCSVKHYAMRTCENKFKAQPITLFNSPMLAYGTIVYSVGMGQGLAYTTVPCSRYIILAFAQR